MSDYNNGDDVSVQANSAKSFSLKNYRERTASAPNGIGKGNRKPRADYRIPDSGYSYGSSSAYRQNREADFVVSLSNDRREVFLDLLERTDWKTLTNSCARCPVIYVGEG